MVDQVSDVSDLQVPNIFEDVTALFDLTPDGWIVIRGQGVAEDLRTSAIMQGKDALHQMTHWVIPKITWNITFSTEEMKQKNKTWFEQTINGIMKYKSCWYLF